MLCKIDDTERMARLRLIRSAGIGPLTYRQLLARAGSAVAALDLVPAGAPSAGRRVVRLANEDDAEREYAAGRDAGFVLLTLGEPDYPESLAAIADPPPVLWLHGASRLFYERSVAIVGARNASVAGRRMAASLAEELGDEGVVITSGLARGIDGAAHSAALTTGTIAVLAGGVDWIYPPEHEALYRSIAERGLVVSEQPIGMAPRAKHFPKRNRIVSGLSCGVVVVEAAERSGTLITARLAAEQGRDVYAVPGSPLDPRSAGTNKLLQAGAHIVTSADDVLRELPSPTQNFLAERLQRFAPSTINDPLDDPDPVVFDEQGSDGLRDRLHDLLGITPIHRDELTQAAEAPASHVAAALTELVLTGDAHEESGGTYVRSGGR